MSDTMPASDADFELAQGALRRGWLTREQVELAILEREKAPGSRLLGLLALSPDQIRELESESRASRPLPPEVQALAQDPEKRVGKYVVVAPLGAGGMGLVLKAYDTQLQGGLRPRSPRLQRGDPAGSQVCQLLGRPRSGTGVHGRLRWSLRGSGHVPIASLRFGLSDACRALRPDFGPAREPRGYRGRPRGHLATRHPVDRLPRRCRGVRPGSRPRPRPRARTRPDRRGGQPRLGARQQGARVQSDRPRGDRLHARHDGPKFYHLFGRTRERWTYLENLKPVLEEGDFIYLHGSLLDPLMDYCFGDRHPLFNPKQLEAIFPKIRRLCFAGHTHFPTVIRDDHACWYPAEGDWSCTLLPGRRYIVNVGSVGQPRDGDPRACYALYEGDRVRFRRIPYDVEKTRQKILAIDSMESRLADRLREGK